MVFAYGLYSISYIKKIFLNQNPHLVISIHLIIQLSINVDLI